MNVEIPTVYVVEDDAETRESFSALFTSHRLQVEAFESGEKLLQHYDRSRLGCIVADYRLRGIDGLSLHRLLTENGCTLPLILISGYLTVASAVKAMEQGVYHVLEKPYRDDELTRVVEDAIRENRESRVRKNFRVDLAHRIEQLDPRERLTLDLIIAGHGNRTIERKLGLSTRSVDRIRRSILDKTNYLSFVELSAAYGAALATEQDATTTTSKNDKGPHWQPDPDSDALEQLNASLLRIQAILLGDEEISEDLRPLLRQAEASLSKGIGRVRAGCRRLPDKLNDAG